MPSHSRGLLVGHFRTSLCHWGSSRQKIANLYEEFDDPSVCISDHNVSPLLDVHGPRSNHIYNLLFVPDIDRLVDVSHQIRWHLDPVLVARKSVSKKKTPSANCQHSTDLDRHIVPQTAPRAILEDPYAVAA